MVTDGTTVWTGTLSATELSSTASEASMEAGEFIQERVQHENKMLFKCFV